MLQDQLQSVARGLLLDRAKRDDGINLCDADYLVSAVLTELASFVLTGPGGERGSGIALRPMVARELAQLIRTGRLTLECDKPFLYLKLSPLALVADR